LTIQRSLIKPKDSIDLFVIPDCCWEPPVAIYLKDTLYHFIRRFEHSGKVAVKDILQYYQADRNRIWILWSDAESKRNATIVWDERRTYPEYHNYPRLLLTVID
jgi:hypothetical protein